MKLKLMSSSIAITSLILVGLMSSNEVLAATLETNPNYIVEDNSVETVSKSREDVIKWFKDNGVDQETINELMNKLDNNEPLDSINPSMKSMGRCVYSDDTQTKVVYPDGSISITGLEGGEIIESPKSRAGLSGGSGSSGSGYSSRRGVKVYHNSGVVDMSYYANYTFVQGGYDKIDGVYNKKCVSYLGTWTYLSFGRQKITENLNGPARARFEVIYNANAGTEASCNYWLDIRVGKDSAKAVFG